ncbi:hypothetical protein ACQP1W_13025 [Spirillospora sp. CA-255316]
MTTDPHDEHGEILRRALHAEAATVIPSAEGLEKIRSRIDERAQRRFGWDWFTAIWARPVMAVAVAVLIAGIGVTAPQTIDLIQSAGSNGTSDKGRHHSSDGDPAGTQGAPPNAQPPASAVPSESGDPSETGTPSPAVSPGSPSCTSAAPTPSAAGTPSPAPSGGSEGGTPSGQCPGPSTSPSPSPSPSDTGSTDPDPTTPTDPPVSEEQPAPAQSEGSSAQ